MIRLIIHPPPRHTEELHLLFSSLVGRDHSHAKEVPINKPSSCWWVVDPQYVFKTTLFLTILQRLCRAHPSGIWSGIHLQSVVPVPNVYIVWELFAQQQTPTNNWNLLQAWRGFDTNKKKQMTLSKSCNHPDRKLIKTRRHPLVPLLHSVCAGWVKPELKE